MTEDRAIELSDVTGIGAHFQMQFQALMDSIAQNAGKLLWNLLVVAVILLLARLALAVISKITGNIISRQRKLRLIHDDSQLRRVDTLMTLLRSTARYFIYFVAILLILSQFEMGETVKNLLVTAGIGSLAIGFGAQSLVKDVVTGLFLMFENQFSVGDYIRIGDVEGTVSATALRATYLTNEKGQQIILPNGSITRVINFSRLGYSTAEVVVTVSVSAGIRQTMELLQQALEEYVKEHPENLLPQGEHKILGITESTNTFVKIALHCQTMPLKHWETERALRLKIKEKMEKAGIV